MSKDIKKNKSGSLTISADTALRLADFIDYQLDCAWDHYTDRYICPNTTWEEGKRRMDPDAYELMEQLRNSL